MSNLKSRFLRTFANLPLGLRNEIAVVAENNTLIGKKGLEILDKLNFLAI